MKRMLLIGCLITILAFSAFGCSGGSKDAHAEEMPPYKPISIRMFDLYAATEDGHVFYRPHDTKVWVTDEDEQAFVNGDKLRYGGKYGMDGMVEAPIIICQPIDYHYAVQKAETEDYGVTPDQIAVYPPPTDLVVQEQHVDIRVYSPEGKLLWYFNGVYISYNDLDIYKAGGNLRFRAVGIDWLSQGTYLVKAPIVTITEDLLIGPITRSDEDGPQGDLLD